MVATYLQSAEDVAKCGLVLLVPQNIYMISITFTMLFVNGKLFWVINLISIFPQLFTLFLCVRMLTNRSDLKIDCLPIWMNVQVAVAFCYFMETLLEGMDQLYTEKAGGKISATVIGLVFVLAWGQLSYEAKVQSENNMTGEKRERFIKSRRNVAVSMSNRNRQNSAQRTQVNQEAVVAPSILQNRARVNSNRAAAPNRAAQEEEEKLNTSLNDGPNRYNEHDEENLMNSEQDLDLEPESSSSLAPSSNQNRYNYGNRPAQSSIQSAKKTAPGAAKADDVRAQRLALLGGGRAAASAAPPTEKTCPVCTFKNAGNAQQCSMCNSGL